MLPIESLDKPSQQVIKEWQLAKAFANSLTLDSIIQSQLGDEGLSLLNGYELATYAGKDALAVKTGNAEEFKHHLITLLRDKGIASFADMIHQYLLKLTENYESLLKASNDNAYVAEALKSQVSAQAEEIAKLNKLIKALQEKLGATAATVEVEDYHTTADDSAMAAAVIGTAYGKVSVKGGSAKASNNSMAAAVVSGDMAEMFFRRRDRDSVSLSHSKTSVVPKR